MTSGLAFQLSGIVQAYNGREVLRVDSLEVEERSILGLAGHNGSGKSTLLRILAFLEPPLRGEVRFQGKSATVRDAAVRRRVTLLTQEPYLLKRTVLENVAYGLKVRGQGGRMERARQALGLVGLDPDMFGRRHWYELSGGEAQRVALAARLAIRPQVLLLDEPTASLDQESARRIQEASLAAREEYGCTLVAVSHDMAWLGSVADRIVTLADGKLLAAS